MAGEKVEGLHLLRGSCWKVFIDFDIWCLSLGKLTWFAPSFRTSFCAGYAGRSELPDNLKANELWMSKMPLASNVCHKVCCGGTFWFRMMAWPDLTYLDTCILILQALFRPCAMMVTGSSRCVMPLFGMLYIVQANHIFEICCFSILRSRTMLLLARLSCIPMAPCPVDVSSVACHDFLNFALGNTTLYSGKWCLVAKITTMVGNFRENHKHHNVGTCWPVARNVISFSSCSGTPLLTSQVLKMRRTLRGRTVLNSWSLSLSL